MGDGRLTRADLDDRVRRGEIDTVLVAIPDVQGRLQGKRMDATFFLDDLDGGAVEGCAYLLATDVDMRTVDGFALTSWDAGYGDLVMVPDFSSLRFVPWHDRTAIVIADVVTTDGAPVSVSPRRVLSAQLENLAARGWHALCGTELEFLVFTDTYEDAWRRHYHGLTPTNSYNVDYSLLGSGRVEPVLGDIRRSMREAGMVVESVKGECHPGQHEIAFRYAEPLDKCDEHALFKLGAKEIAARHGCSLTFMAKFDELEGNSCHIHLSVRDANDQAVFDDAGQRSEVFESFLAGLIAHSAELTLLFAPTINSYKRFAPGSFAPTALLWGDDNRTCAFRVVGHGPSLRVECRIPGGDANPYLAVAALLAAGLAGVDAQLAPVPPFSGDAYRANAPRVPSSLAEAVALFGASELAGRAFGAEVVAHYVRAGEVEREAFGSAVTDWERVRGFERW